MKSFWPAEVSGSDEPPPGGRNTEADFRGEKRSNATHTSTTYPDAKLDRKGPGMEAGLTFLGHALMENYSGLIVDACLTKVCGHAERVAALAMIEPHAYRPRPMTLSADLGYDASDFVNELRSMKVRLHVMQNLTRRLGRSAIDGGTTRHPGYAASQRARKRIEEGFGWRKVVAGLVRPKLRGLDRVGWALAGPSALGDAGERHRDRDAGDATAARVGADRHAQASTPEPKI